MTRRLISSFRCYLSSAAILDSLTMSTPTRHTYICRLHRAPMTLTCKQENHPYSTWATRTEKSTILTTLSSGIGRRSQSTRAWRALIQLSGSLIICAGTSTWQSSCITSHFRSSLMTLSRELAVLPQFRIRALLFVMHASLHKTYTIPRLCSSKMPATYDHMPYDLFANSCVPCRS